MRVFLPLDGSEKDERAAQVADAFANLVHGNLHIVRVVEAHASIEQHLRELAGRLSSGGRRAVTWEVIDGADVAKELLDRAEQSADVIVMATRAPGTVARAFYGSVADELVRKASRPVVVVPPGARYGQGNRIEIRRVLVPLDGSAAALTAIDRLRELVTTENLEYVLMQAVHRESPGRYMMPEPVPRRQPVTSPQTALLYCMSRRNMPNGICRGWRSSCVATAIPRPSALWSMAIPRPRSWKQSVQSLWI